MTTTSTASSTATTTAARDHARSQAGRHAEAMPTVPARDAVDLPPGVSPDDVVWDETVAGGGYTHRFVAAGTEIRLTDVHGDACANLVLFNGLDPWERLNVADTVKVQWQAYLGAGALLLSDQGRALATIVEDTSGHHDALCGASTVAANVARYGDGSPQGPSPSARALLVLAAAKQGLEPRDLGPSVALFKGTLVADDGRVELRDGPEGPSHVTLRAELPLVVLVANVPHVLDPRPDYTVTTLRVTAVRGVPTGPDDPQWRSSPERERAYLNAADYAGARGLTAGGAA
jgi:urea carboxylase-associated protein 2